MPPAKGTKRPAASGSATNSKRQKIEQTSEKKKTSSKCRSSTDLDEFVIGPESEAATAALTESLRDAAWKGALKDEFAKPYFHSIAHFVASERSKGTVHPPAENVFEAFNMASLKDVKVVILGQDPYHEPGQAHGLCFSVPHGIKPPPSLKNMYKELEVDVPGFTAPEHGNLMQWAKQGVLLLNATLTVREGHTEANSHSKCGWQKFTDAVIRVLNEHTEKLVFLLWGGNAQKKGEIIDQSRHKVIESAHPSPLSFKKWQGCKAFSKCNEALRDLGRPEVDWTLDPAPGSEQSKLESFFSKSQSSRNSKTQGSSKSTSSQTL